MLEVEAQADWNGLFFLFLKKKENLDSLEPYTRYTVTLHVRTEKNTCNMKHVNSSESTYGSTQFYLQEGCE